MFSSSDLFSSPERYNPFLVYCRELAPGTVSLTGDRAQGDDSKHDSHYRCSKGLVMVTQCSTRVASIICIRPNKENKCFSGQVSEILGRVGTHIFF